MGKVSKACKTARHQQTDSNEQRTAEMLRPYRLLGTNGGPPNVGDVSNFSVCRG